MTLYVRNANDVIIKQAKYNLNGALITEADFLGSILLENTAVITAVSAHATAPVITMDVTTHGIVSGDRIFCNGVRGATGVNGFLDVTGVSGADITVDGNTNGETYLTNGKLRSVVVEDQVFITIILDESTEYYTTFADTVDLIPETSYVILIRDTVLQVEIEFPETSKIRVAGK